jgi:hypothetical protein
MTLTREQVADLQPGDVVEIVQGTWPAGTTLRGPLRESRTGTLFIGDVVIRHNDGFPRRWNDFTLTVISRAPRPLYVNHPRTEPVPGDVVRDEEAGVDPALVVLRISVRPGIETWMDQDGQERTYAHLSPPRRLHLLVDGETGQAVTQ